MTTAAEQRARIAVVEDDDAVRDSLVRLLEASGYEARPFAEGTTFLASLKEVTPDVVILDLQLPGMTGLQIQGLLRDRLPQTPVIFLTAYGTVPASVAAMRTGAVDFLEKPADPNFFLDALGRAVQLARREQTALGLQDAAKKRIEALSPRELEVMHLLIEGASSKRITQELGIALQTAKVHRMRVMRKLQVDSLSELVRLSDQAEGRIHDENLPGVAPAPAADEFA
jgi:two-component system, LuxR family, response regulator FixJ